MDTFHSAIEIAAEPGVLFESLDALVDSGATDTLMPKTVFVRLGVARIDRQAFLIADGSGAGRNIGEAAIRIGRRTHAPIVVFGDTHTEPLLGTVTIEELGLGTDPVGRWLVPMPNNLAGLNPGDTHDS